MSKLTVTLTDIVCCQVDNTDKVKQINRKLSQVEASAGKLDQLTRELKRAVRTHICQKYGGISAAR